MLGWLRQKNKNQPEEADREAEAQQPVDLSLELGAASLEASAATAEPVDYSTPLLTVEGVERSFPVGGQQLHVLKGIHMSLYHRQLVMLKGRSGSGKTTLLNLIGGLTSRTRARLCLKIIRFICAATISVRK